MAHLLHLAAVIETDASITQRAQMAVITVLIEGHQHVCLIARMQHLPGAYVHLKDGRPATDRGRNGHVGHDLLGRSSGKPSQEATDGLDAIL